MHKVDDARVTLRIVGNPATPQMRSLVEDACTQDPRISALLAYVEEPVLAREVSEAELVVLPYRQMHNSGTLLLALSLARPVLAPWSESNAAIAEEVGPGWVFLYEGEFDAPLLTGMLDKVRAAPRGRYRIFRSGTGHGSGSCTTAPIWKRWARTETPRCDRRDTYEDISHSTAASATQPGLARCRRRSSDHAWPVGQDGGAVRRHHPVGAIADALRLRPDGDGHRDCGAAEILRDFGLSAAAVQAKHVSREQRDNLFWINSGIGLLLSLVVFASAHLIANFYKEPAW